MKLTTVSFLLFCVCALLISCTSNESRIIGTWVPLGDSGQENPDLKIHFKKDHYIYAENIYDKEKSRDSISYEIKNDGKLLVTKEQSGKIDELVILELTDKNLVMHPKKDNKDTIRFVRSK